MGRGGFRRKGGPQNCRAEGAQSNAITFDLRGLRRGRSSLLEEAVSAYETLLPRLEPEVLAANPNPALLLAECLEVAHARGWQLDRFAGPFRQACKHALEHCQPPERAALWRTLGHIGLDERIGIGVTNGLPDIDWVEISAGEFQYGDKRRKIKLDTFGIARYPITNAQFQAFIDHPEGYAAERWWAGLAERFETPEPSRWNSVNHPRETVSWYEAMAFCRWLDAHFRPPDLGI